MSFRTCACLPFVFIVTACSAWGLELTPFAVRNFSPPAIVHGLPIAETARLLNAGQVSARVSLDLSNIATDNTAKDELIYLDGETHVVTAGLRYGINDQLQLGLDLPWVSQSEGFLDSFIKDFHDWFGLPDGDRKDMENDQIEYLYQRNGDTRLFLDDEVDGLGDIRLLLAWQYARSDNSAVALQAQVKLPTGDADKLTGSEAFDVALSLSAQRDFPLSIGQGAVWAGAGISYLGDGDVIEDDVEDFAASGWLGSGWQPLDWLALKLQLDVHSALYDSDLTELGDPAVILTMGGSIGIGEKTFLDLGVGEDLNINASPDVTFHLALQHQF
ncbi:MAG: DUF3187 family protein [Deltaproteobacteria bacterium]|jgi:hypothetical protein|nr:DUF3187 family protein [Deltaproteobacteria bacterium]MBW2519771.1 DUF3187 family protein [Deltaproteobacteria bacterium]